jgi:hypothetical protein
MYRVNAIIFIGVDSTSIKKKQKGKRKMVSHRSDPLRDDDHDDHPFYG